MTGITQSEMTTWRSSLRVSCSMASAPFVTATTSCPSPSSTLRRSKLEVRSSSAINTFIDTPAKSGPYELEAVVSRRGHEPEQD